MMHKWVAFREPLTLPRVVVSTNGTEGLLLLTVFSGNAPEVQIGVTMARSTFWPIIRTTVEVKHICA